MTESRKVCDIVGCDCTATECLDTVVYAYRTDQGLFIRTIYNVDLCGKHEHEYRTALPELVVKPLE